MNIETSKSFIAENGTDLENARLQYVLYETAPGPEILAGFTGLQNKDGGFPCGLVELEPSSIDRTHLALWWLEELGILKSPVVEQALDFLVRKQSGDGCWDEDPSLTRHSLPSWIIPGDLLTRLYLTAYSAYWLGAAGRGGHPAFRKALDFLMEYQDDSGKFFGYLHTTWLANSAFIMEGDRYAVTVKRGMQALMDRPLSEFEASQIAWLLNCLATAGLLKNHPVATHFLVKLRQLRRPDGSWASEDGDVHAVDATIETLRALKRFGLLVSIS